MNRVQIQTRKLSGTKMMVENRNTIPFFFSPKAYLIFILIINSGTLTAQFNDTTVVDKRKLHILTVGFGAGYGASLVGMQHLWYKNSPQQSFRFFNDNAEWKQVDKLGHFYSGFYFSYGTSRALQWCNMPAKKSDWYGALTGFLVLVPIEIFDGFSDAYGASAGDLIANAAGSAFYIGQRSLWKEVRLFPKFSFHSTNYASERPEVLGDNGIAEIFKDYNGQTYWLSADMDKFMNFPKWLNLSVGYGAHDMFYARDKPNKMEGYNPYRQYYISLDLDFTSIRTRSKVIKTLIFIASMVKLPSPTVEFSNKKAHFHPLYF